jgi:hypothetical protein
MPQALHVSAVHHSPTQLANALILHAQPHNFTAPLHVVATARQVPHYHRHVHATSYGIQPFADVTLTQLQYAPTQLHISSTTSSDNATVNARMPQALHASAMHHSPTQLANALILHATPHKFTAPALVDVSAQSVPHYHRHVHATSYGTQPFADVTLTQLQYAQIPIYTSSITLQEFVHVNARVPQLPLVHA